MPPTTIDLECPFCGFAQKSHERKLGCPNCGTEMVEVGFFNVQQTMQIGQQTKPSRNNWIGIVLIFLIGLMAAGTILVLKNVQDRKPAIEKQEPAKTKP